MDNDEVKNLIKDAKSELVDRGVYENSSIITRINEFLRANTKIALNQCDRCHELNSIFVKTTDGANDMIYCIDCLIELIDLKKMHELNEKYHFQSYIPKSDA